jgi:hypothetical protein
MLKQLSSIILAAVIILFNYAELFCQELKINNDGYFEMPGLTVMVHNDIYPEGHQGGITIIQHGSRVATNGDLTLTSTPGQWQPYPRLIKKEILKDKNEIAVTLQFPDSSREQTEDQPIIYPDFKLTYQIRVIAEGDLFHIIIDLEKPLPKDWVGKVGFNLELYPGDLFGKTYLVDDQSGVFPQYANTPVKKSAGWELETIPMAEGKTLVIAPEDDYRRITITNSKGLLQLLDGRVEHNNGWFIVRSLVPAGAAKNAVELVVKPNTVKGWMYKPVIHISEAGYFPDQTKTAVIELDKRDTSNEKVLIEKIIPQGGFETVLSIDPVQAGNFLRYKYIKADFSSVKKPGMYVVRFGKLISDPFKISEDVFKTGVWQPSIDYFLPAQMCHMKVFEKYRVWHDICHLDDALMAPENINHFDVYAQYKIPEPLKLLQHINGLNKGGWHDAGDYDIRFESQIGTILKLAYAYEEFNLKNYDQTLIDEDEGIVEIHYPDGKPDVLQQIEHGLLSVIGSYKNMGQFYRGIICPTLRQYTLLGEAGEMTDNEVYKGKLPQKYEGFWYDHISNKYDKYFYVQNNRNTQKEFVKDLDDRLVFTDENPGYQIYGVAGLAAAARVLKGYNNDLSKECLNIAEKVWKEYRSVEGKRIVNRKIEALVELILTTGKQNYKDDLVNMLPDIEKNINEAGWMVGRVINEINNEKFAAGVNKEILKVKDHIDSAVKENPFGVPYHPEIWGAGWGIQEFGFRHYFLHKSWPGLFSIEPMLSALNFILGCHPGENTASFVSNVGANSQTVAYGFNMADWSFIPGGDISGTNLVRPDLPELKKWPYLWQQTEYVVGGGATNFVFLVLAADKVLKEMK